MEQPRLRPLWWFLGFPLHINHLSCAKVWLNSRETTIFREGFTFFPPFAILYPLLNLELRNVQAPFHLSQFWGWETHPLKLFLAHPIFGFVPRFKSVCAVRLLWRLRNETIFFGLFFEEGAIYFIKKSVSGYVLRITLAQNKSWNKCSKHFPFFCPEMPTGLCHVFFLLLFLGQQKFLSGKVEFGKVLFNQGEFAELTELQLNMALTASVGSCFIVGRILTGNEFM